MSQSSARHARPSVDDYSDARYIDLFKRVLLQHEDELVQVLFEADEAEHYSVHMGMYQLLDEDHMAAFIYSHPLKLLPLFNEAARQAQHAIIASHPASDRMVFKPHIHVRVVDIPTVDKMHRYRIPRADDIGQFLAIEGTVIRVTTVKTLEAEREYVCAKCKTTFMVKADFEQRYSIAPPTKCPSNDAADPCDSTKFRPAAADAAQRAGTTTCRDYQEVKIQEQVQRLPVGTIPRTMWVILENDLVDSVSAGDDVIVNGVMRRRWSNLRQDSRCDIETVCHANNIKVCNNQHRVLAITDETKEEFLQFWEEYQDMPLKGRNDIISAFCPQVFGLYVVKLAIMMVIVGGVPKVDRSGTRVRGESHMLLVGDPGTGKSQFLKFASRLVPRSVVTTGVGSTSAGLTVTAVKDGGEWTLEAGALVLADNGLCCIDEFSGIREHDRGSIHEAMEQQTLSVAKAGLVCKLNTRTTVLAATNPKGQYDPEESISVNIALASPLLSRFDIIMVLMDTKNPEWDKIVSNFILGLDEESAQRRQAQPSRRWTIEKLQIYVAFIKTLEPALSPECELVLTRYYQLQRQADNKHSARTTVRLLEGTVRLAQAHARIMCRNSVTLQDAVVAVTVMESSMQGAALLGACSPLHSAFPEDPDEEYIRQEQMVLTALGLTELLQSHSSKGNGDPIASADDSTASAAREHAPEPGASMSDIDNPSTTDASVTPRVVPGGAMSQAWGLRNGNIANDDVDGHSDSSRQDLADAANEGRDDLDELDDIFGTPILPNQEAAAATGTQQSQHPPDSQADSSGSSDETPLSQKSAYSQQRVLAKSSQHTRAPEPEKDSDHHSDQHPSPTATKRKRKDINVHSDKRLRRRSDVINDFSTPDDSADVCNGDDTTAPDEENVPRLSSRPSVGKDSQGVAASMERISALSAFAFKKDVRKGASPLNSENQLVNTTANKEKRQTNEQPRLRQFLDDEEDDD